MSDPAIKTEQFKHQREIYLKHRDDRFFALFWEMGLGKTKVMLDVASHLYLQKKIDALLVIAPNSVYKNWLSQELPVHLAVEYSGMAYPKANNERNRIKKLIFLDPTFKSNTLRVMCISYDSISTTHGLQFTKKMLTVYRTMTVADESTAIKRPSSLRSKRAKVVGKMSEYRWIATGTPAAESPFDLHSQIDFLDEEFWAGFGMKTVRAFKNEFGEFVLRRLANGRQFPELKRYRRLDVLHKIIDPISSRLLKEDSEVELPPKTYAVRTFEMTKKQKDLYEQVRDGYEADLDNGLRIEAPLAIVRLARLQQITSGFVTAEERVEDTEEITDNDQLKIFNIERQIEDIVPIEENPKLKLLVELLDECHHKVIVWCKFRRDVNNIMRILGHRGIKYDGTVSSGERELALNRFRNPEDPAQVLVVNIATINQGVTLTIAKTMIYYSNHFSLEKRLQSEDRNHRIGQDQPVLIIDLAAENTVDEKIIQRLREKFDIASIVTGDRFREWIQINDVD